MKKLESKKLLFLFLALICYPLSYAKFSVNNLQTEFMKNPIGIDVRQPRFGWQMQSDRYKTIQKAYRILVSSSLENLNNGKYVYDSGKILSSVSVGIPYQGENLKPASRYYWKVEVWDNKNKRSDSGTEWFETGLSDGNWYHAQWIGSANYLLSKYRSLFTLEYDFQIEKNSNKAVFVFGAKDKDNYISIGIDLKDKARLIISHVTNGKEKVDAESDISGTISKNEKFGKHHVKIDARGPYRYDLYIEIDGKRIKSNDKQGADNYLFVADNSVQGEYNKYCRLYGIGFLQPDHEYATFSNLCVKENAWKTTLYRDEENHKTDGKGEILLWQPGSDVSAPMLRKTINIKKGIKNASMYVTARGIYECYINGKRVGKDYLNPGWTDYRYRIMYNAYDITSLLKEGNNCIGAVLGTGWFSNVLAYDVNLQDQYGIKQSLLALISIEYTDGTKENIVSDGTWKCCDKGPIETNSLYDGEDYNATKEINAWSEGNFDDSKWDRASIIPSPSANVKLQAYIGQAVGNDTTLTALSVKKTGDAYIYDFGQNIAGIPNLSNMKGRKGQTITVRYAEMLYPDSIPEKPVPPYTVEMYREKKGRMYTDNYRSALSTDHYTFKGDANGENFEPIFTQHGFRYLSIEGLDAPLPLESVKGVVLESVGRQQSGYETSNKDINRLFENIVWGQRGNFISIPTDCPQRDERLGWCGDAQIFSRSATYNMNVDPFYTRWMNTLRDDQIESGAYAGFFPTVGLPPQGASGKYADAISGGWQEVGVIIPWQVYQQYGDKGILEQHYESMVKFIDYMKKNASNYIQPSGGFGDWIAPVNTNSNLVNTAYSAYAAQIMGKIAGVLGKTEDTKKYETLYQNIKEAFDKTFLNKEGYTVAPAEMFNTDKVALPEGVPPIQKVSGNEAVTVDTQTSYILPLAFGLVDGDQKESAFRHLLETVGKSGYRLMTGFLGTPYICNVLSDNGHSEEAYRLFLQTEYPSWLFPVKQGATTMWERWNSYTIKNGFGPVSMNSFNHYAYGAIEEWIMSHSLGIQRDENIPAYQHFILQPETNDSLKFAKGGFESVYGRINSSWEKTSEGDRYEFSVPANTSATLYLPTSNEKAVKILKGKKGILSRTYVKGKTKYEIGSGEYEFIVH